MARALRTRTGVLLHDRRTIAFLPIALYLCAYALRTPLLFFNDTWLAILAGDQVAHHGVPHVEHWTTWAAGRPWIDQQWLGQLLFGEVHRLGGYFGIWLFGAACMGGCLALLGATTRRAGLDVVRGAPVVVLLAAALFPFALLRTQTVAFLYFGAIVYLLYRASDDGRWAWLALPILALWANTHGSALMGVILVAVWGLDQCYRSASSRARATHGALALLAVASTLATPYGLDMIDYYRSVLGKPGFGDVSGEWSATTLSFGQATSYLFFPTLAGFLLVLGAWRKRVRLYEWVWLALLLYLALRGVRFQVWFMLTGGVVLARAAVAGAGRATAPPVPRVHAAMAAVALAALVLLTAVVALQPDSYYVGKTRAGSLAAVSGYMERHADARLLGLAPQVDYFMWADHSIRGRALVDARIELLTSHELRQLVKFTGGVEGWPRLLQREEIGIVSGDRNYRGTLRRLHRIGWRTLYDHHGTFVVARH